ncbi:altered inheritance of mitochondria protein 21-like [Helianthus annuus]|uniref:altered inheritance of mitochondria protein 21-like n=1 Tax=Helianthus annuus TaxID=4232 RepID=UPI000B902C7B|nr:altered inheritance of mitochondria protein 21-like [Helianthus annuus]
MTEEPKSLSEMVNSLLCTGNCRKKDAFMRSKNSPLITDYNNAMGKYINLRENHKILYEKIEALKKDIAQLHRDVNQQQSDKSDHENEPVNTSADEMEESSQNSDSVKNTNCSSSCAESVRTEEKSKEDDESHQRAANNVISDKNDLYAWKYVFSWFAETWDVPTKTDESGESDVSTEELDTSVSSDSKINSDDSGNCSSTPETSNDTLETPCNDEKLDIFHCDNEEIVEQGSSDDLGNQTQDSGISDKEHKSSKDFDCDKQSESGSIASKDSQIVLDTECSSSDLPESSNVKNSEVDKVEEETSIESNSAEIHGNTKTIEKKSMEINSTIESDDETIEETIMETFSTETPENIVSEERESAEVTSTDNSTLDPKGSDSENGDFNKAKSTESVPSKKKWSRRNRRPRKKNVQKENPNLRQTKPKLESKFADTFSSADSCEQGSSKIKHTRKH